MWIRPWWCKGVGGPSAARMYPPALLGFQLLAFSCVFPLECPLYDTLAHSTRAWLLVTQTHLPTRACSLRVHLIRSYVRARFPCGVALYSGIRVCTCVRSASSVVRRTDTSTRTSARALVIWQGVTIDWLPRQGLPIKFSLQTSAARD